MQQMRLLGRRLFVIFGLAVIIFLVMDFNNRMADRARLAAQHGIESRQLVGMRATQTFLETEIAYANSDSAVEDAVREDGRWILPGDYPVIPLTPIGFEPEPDVFAAPPPEPLSNWDLWMALFFGLDP